jgi:hypothetical protein
MNVAEKQEIDRQYNELMELQKYEPTLMDEYAPMVWKYQECPWRAVTSDGHLYYFEGEPEIDHGGYFGEDTWKYKGQRSKKVEMNAVYKGNSISNWMNMKENRND